MSEEGHIPIRSYRLCFDLERRIHQVDRWRIPLPYGLPLRGLAYAGLGLVAVIALGRVPLLGAAVTAIHPAARFVVAPCLLALLLVRVRVDGRPAHAHAAALARQAVAPRFVAGFRAVRASTTVRLADVELAGDGGDVRLRPAVVRGPCRVLVRYPATADRRGRTLRLRQRGERPLWRAKAVVVPNRGRLVVDR